MEMYNRLTLLLHLKLTPGKVNYTPIIFLKTWTRIQIDPKGSILWGELEEQLK